MNNCKEDLSKLNSQRIFYLKALVFFFFLASVFFTTNLFSQVKSPKIATDSLKKTSSLLFNHIRFDTVSIDVKPELLKEMGEYTISGGTLFLSGAGFYAPKVFAINGVFELFEREYNQIIVGTRFTLDKCVLKTKEGKTIILTKSFFFK